jgi:hypothetical protein
MQAGIGVEADIFEASPGSEAMFARLEASSCAAEFVDTASGPGRYFSSIRIDTPLDCSTTVLSYRPESCRESKSRNLNDTRHT